MSFFKLFMRWIWIWMLSWDRLIVLLLQLLLKSAALPPIRYSHAGICPNDMNPNLWVDAQSTCGRECDADLETAVCIVSQGKDLIHTHFKIQHRYKNDNLARAVE